MLRRTAIKKIGILTGGMILLHSCNFSEEKATIVLNNLKITSDQEKILKAVVSTLIPEGDIPGAVSLGVDHFVWIMIDDVLSKKRQKNFIEGLDSFDLEINTKYKKSFDQLNPEDQLKALISTSEKSKNIQVLNFITTTKYLTQKGYMQSKYIMTEIMPYALIPGSYNNCKKTDTKERINIYG